MSPFQLVKLVLQLYITFSRRVSVSTSPAAKKLFKLTPILQYGYAYNKGKIIFYLKTESKNKADFKVL